MIIFDLAITFFPMQPSHRHARRDFVPDSLMTSPIVVTINKVRNSTPQCNHVILRVQVDIFSLNGPPKALYLDIIKASGYAVHTNLYSISLTSFLPLLAGGLAYLVGVDDFRCTIFLNRPFQNLNGIGSIKCVIKIYSDYRPLLLHINT